jgi:hypothetical protein
VKRKANHHLYQRTNHSSSNINSNIFSKGNYINNLFGPQQLLSLLRPSRTSISNSSFTSNSIISNSSKSRISKSS